MVGWNGPSMERQYVGPIRRLEFLFYVLDGGTTDAQSVLSIKWWTVVYTVVLHLINFVSFIGPHTSTYGSWVEVVLSSVLAIFQQTHNQTRPTYAFDIYICSSSSLRLW